MSESHTKSGLGERRGKEDRERREKRSDSFNNSGFKKNLGFVRLSK